LISAWIDVLLQKAGNLPLSTSPGQGLSAVMARALSSAVARIIKCTDHLFVFNAKHWPPRSS
jgi:hypothetical protein